MPDPMNRYRPPPQGRLDELIALRKQRYPKMLAKDFARDILDVSRLYMGSIEHGRRRPSLTLALKWLAALGPTARLDLFGDMSHVERDLALLRKAQKLKIAA